MQSEPCRRRDDHDMFAGGHDRLRIRNAVAGHALVWLWQKFHGEMHALQLASRNRQIARVFGTAGQRHGIEVFINAVQ